MSFSFFSLAYLDLISKPSSPEEPGLFSDMVSVPTSGKQIKDERETFRNFLQAINLIPRVAEQQDTASTFSVSTKLRYLHVHLVDGGFDNLAKKGKGKGKNRVETEDRNKRRRQVGGGKNAILSSAFELFDFEFSFVPRSCQDEKTYFFISLLYFFTKFIVSVAQHRSAESEGLRFDSSKGLSFFCLTLVTRRKNIFLNLKLDKISTGIFSLLMYMVNNVLVNTDTTLHQNFASELSFYCKELAACISSPVHSWSSGLRNRKVGG